MRNAKQGNYLKTALTPLYEWFAIFLAAYLISFKWANDTDNNDCYNQMLVGTLEIVLDRRLSQDDNRGLGQGVMDNKRTPADFRLLLEKFKNTKESVSSALHLFPNINKSTMKDLVSEPIMPCANV